MRRSTSAPSTNGSKRADTARWSSAVSCLRSSPRTGASPKWIDASTCGSQRNSRRCAPSGMSPHQETGEVGRRLALRRAVVDRGVVDAPREPMANSSSGERNGITRSPRPRGPLGEDHHPLPGAERLLDAGEDLRQLPLRPAVDEDRVDRTADGAEDRPAVDLRLGDEDAGQLRAEDEDVDVAQVVRDQEERRLRRRSAHRHAHAEDPAERLRPDLVGPALAAHREAAREDRAGARRERHESRRTA